MRRKICFHGDFCLERAGGQNGGVWLGHRASFGIGLCAGGCPWGRTVDCGVAGYGGRAGFGEEGAALGIEGVAERATRSPMVSEPFIDLARVEKTYRMGRLDYPPLRGIDLEIGAGELAAAVGPGVRGGVDARIHPRAGPGHRVRGGSMRASTPWAGLRPRVRGGSMRASTPWAGLRPRARGGSIRASMVVFGGGCGHPSIP